MQYLETSCVKPAPELEGSGRSASNLTKEVKSERLEKKCWRQRVKRPAPTTKCIHMSGWQTKQKCAQADALVIQEHSRGQALAIPAGVREKVKV